MRTPTVKLLVLLAVCLAVSTPLAGADGPPAPVVPAPGEAISWRATLPEAFDAATKEDKPIFIAINAEKIGGRIEPANKELREHTYLDAAVVAKSKSFVCALVRQDGGTGDYAELRGRFQIDGEITAPQHVFAFPDGKLIYRREYWPEAAGQASVDKLIAMMDEALKADATRRGAPPPAPSDPSKPADPAAPAPAGDPAGGMDRAEFIRTGLLRLRTAQDDEARASAIKDLLLGDKGGDCAEALATLLVDSKKDLPLQRAILHGLGKPGLEVVVPAVVSFLDDREEDLRAEAAVTLEYIGSTRAIEPLTKRVTREKEDRVLGDVLRALGRCGAKQEPVRKALAHQLGTAKSPAAIVGPSVGLAYFEKDAEVARLLEKTVKKEEERIRRAYLLYALSEVGDPASATFVRKELLASEGNRLVQQFLESVAKRIEDPSNEEAKQAIEYGMGAVSWAIPRDAARRDRDQSEFKPKGEFGRGPGPGGRGGPPGGPPPGMGG